MKSGVIYTNKKGKIRVNETLIDPRKTIPGFIKSELNENQILRAKKKIMIDMDFNVSIQ
jgi:hypothetical protein